MLSVPVRLRGRHHNGRDLTFKTFVEPASARCWPACRDRGHLGDYPGRRVRPTLLAYLYLRHEVIIMPGSALPRRKIDGGGGISIQPQDGLSTWTEAKARASRLPASAPLRWWNGPKAATKSAACGLEREGGGGGGEGGGGGGGGVVGVD